MHTYKFFLILIFFISAVYSSSNEEFRKINIKDFEGDQSYLPLKAGQKFIIELEGNPTTGYMWYLEETEKINKELLTTLNLKENNTGEYYKRQPQENDPEIVRFGIEGIFHFKFQASETNFGEEVLRFVYKRSWTNEGEVRKRINLKIVRLHDESEL